MLLPAVACVQLGVSPGDAVGATAPISNVSPVCCQRLSPRDTRVQPHISLLYLLGDTHGFTKEIPLPKREYLQSDIYRGTLVYHLDITARYPNCSTCVRLL